ncbi:hypothetical protein ACN38_g8564 [Penicillium nordicum]|uniref:Uncharacterized protein n=1 Tax=Penicillium nordicum TaxID=229535 RepID=A0A0M9WDE5_9EURO|nr:hypothetical protein ACN38_g8564 [Penicillium nordicum]
MEEKNVDPWKRGQRKEKNPWPFSSPSSSSSLSLPLQLPFVQQFFLSFVWVIVRLYFPVARHARFARASIPRCSLIGAVPTIFPVKIAHR